jgi:hypothetical protein
MRTKTKELDPPRGTFKADTKPSDPPDLAHLIRRFDPDRRASVRRLVNSSPRAADLAIVFPGALYAISDSNGSIDIRRRALELVLEGAALRDVAQVLDLPLWLRRLPPEAFTGSIGPLPASEMFSRRIVNQLPTAAENSAFWLKAVSFGAYACDEYFALWLARQPVYSESGDPARLFGLLAAYAWYSQAELSRAHGLIVVPWRPEMSLDTAICAAKSWLNRIRLVLQLGPGAITDSWLQAGEAQSFSFVPLLEQSQILAESRAMQNCADQYADRLARDKCRLFSVRRRGVRVATLEIGPHARETGVLAINQLKARHNMPASAEIWQAAHTWLGTQKDLKRAVTLNPPYRPLDGEAWQSLTAAYRASQYGAPWLPERLDTDTLATLDADIAALARRAGVTSWLFT